MKTYNIGNTIDRFFHSIRYAVQRIRRGWSDKDACCAGSWVAKTLPNMLRRIADKTIGVPVSFIVNNGCKLEADCEHELALQAWTKALRDTADLLEESCEDTCKRKNPMAQPNFSHEWVDCGDGSDGRPLSVLYNIGSNEENDKWNKWKDAEAELETYRVECKDKAMKFITEYWYCLEW